jgi:multicomponent Na+:H+ antiporter subunit D
MRESQDLPLILRSAGMSMLILGGGWMAFESSLNRMMAYATIAEIGFGLLAMGLPDQMTAVQIIFLSLLPRALALGLWALSTSIIQTQTQDLKLSALKGIGRQLPIASIGIVIAQLSIFGLPLLAAFPYHMVLWKNLAQLSIPFAVGFAIGIGGLLIGALRTLSALINASTEKWQIKETPFQSGLIGIGVISLGLLGITPQIAQVLLIQLPNIFEHLGK